jgi:hypothetical protein
MKKFLIKSICCLLLIGSPFQASYAMDEKFTLQQELKNEINVPVTQGGYVAAATRLNLFKTLISQNPNMTMSTKVNASHILWPLYSKDKAFIEKEIKKRTNPETLQKALRYIDEKIQDLGWNQQMSLLDLNFIGMLWVQILSASPESYEHAKPSDIPQYNHLTEKDFLNFLTPAYLDTMFQKYETFKETGSEKDSALLGYLHDLINSHVFCLPHISPTGSFPLKLMMESWGFFTNPQETSAAHLDFVAVPTNPVNNFDYAIDFPPLWVWTHDIIHASKYNFPDKNDAKAYTLKTAKMLKAINKSGFTQEQLATIAIAFFHTFHEKSSPVYDMEDRIETLRFQLSKKIDSEITPGERFDSLEQYKNLVDGIEKVLRPKIEGDTLIDKYKSYLKLYLAGLELLEKFAHIYDN